MQHKNFDTPSLVSLGDTRANKFLNKHFSLMLEINPNMSELKETLADFYIDSIIGQENEDQRLLVNKARIYIAINKLITDYESLQFGEK
ncbi:MAG: hypothetical protein KGZ97_06805 [Bacteroidetes bacterium]|nr:hypothetical protein [Bacteroidota bacterium]